MAVAAVIALYAVLLGIGIAGARKALKGGWSELLVAGRAMPLWLAVLTMTATWVDGGYLLGVPLTTAIVNWWDVSAMLVLGGIPWNCYFQRVLSCQSPARAQWHSILAGVLTMGFTIPPLLLGVAAFAHHWPPALGAEIAARPAGTLPTVLRYLTPGWIGVLGLGAIIGAVTSSFSASILSAGSMIAWNGVYRLWRPTLSPAQLSRLIRVVVVALGAAATVMALGVQSVQALWFFTSDLVFVLLFPQLVFALFDRRVNRIGSVAAFAVSLAIRLGGGEPLFHVAPLARYPEIFSAVLPGPPASWYDAAGAMLFPYKTMAAVAGVIILPVVSRLTARWDRPRPLRNVHADGVGPDGGV